MIEIPGVIPVVAVIAIALFFAKESIEWIRRSAANRRKLKAIRRILSLECERNKFSIGTLLSQVNDLMASIDNGHIASIEPAPQVIPVLKFTGEGGNFSSKPVNPVHTSALEKYLFDVATLDEGLFALMERALEALTEASHVRESLIELITNEETGFFESFCEYAKDELDEANDSIRELYFNCTGQPLTQGRVR